MKIKLLSCVSFIFAICLTACTTSNNSTDFSVSEETHVHSFKDTWNHDETYHWHESNCGHDVVSNKERHSFTDVVTDPSYLSGGYTTHTCTICGYSYIDSETDKLKVTITWKNYDDTVITSESYNYGETPFYKGETPIRERDEQYSYTFNGWSPEIVAATFDTSYVATFSNNLENAKISFDLDGGITAHSTSPIFRPSIEADDFFFDCVKDGWNFRGWSFNGTKIFDEKGNKLTNPTLAKDMTFVAMYAQTAKMTIEKNMLEAGTVTGEGEYPYNTYVDVSARAKQGYVFVGWYYQNTLLSSTEDYKYMMWSEDVTLEARFKLDSYLLSIHTNNSDYGLVMLKSASNLNYLSQYEEYRDYTTQATIAAYSKTDVRFLGWYDTNNKLVETNAVYSFTMPNHNYTLEAKWNYFKVSYILNGGTNNPSNPTNYTVDSTTGLALFDPSKDGYEFLGWKYENDYVTEINPTWIDDVTLTAEWAPKQYNISIETEDTFKGTASIISGSGYTDESITVEAMPKNDYVFKGWYHESKLLNCNPIYTFTMPASNYSLVARFYSQEDARQLCAIPTISSDGKTITYGLYPQEHVTSSSLISALNNLTESEFNGWYFYNGEYYASLNAKPFNREYDSVKGEFTYVDNYKFDDGSKITNGKKYWFKCQPITWKILSNNNGEYYLLSSVLLDEHRYNEFYEGLKNGRYANNYKYSDIRSWLNGEFYDTAFSLGNSYIQTTIVDNSAVTTDSNNNSYVCDNTQDKVFLPSYKDYLNTSYGFTNSGNPVASRICKTTDFARARGTYYSTSYYSSYSCYYCDWYWTRSPSSDYSNSATVVSYTGGKSSSKVGGYSYYEPSHIGVRPAIVISIA